MVESILPQPDLRRLAEERHISATWRVAGAETPIAWQINREIVVMLGWGPAVLMQLAHPLVATGIAEHSAFLNQPGARVRRLHQTISAMLMLTFGTPKQIAATAATINELHDHIHGQIAEPLGSFAAGTPYSAHDPELLRWVQATLLDNLLRAYERVVAPLTPAERDRYCAQAAIVGPLLGAPEGYFPESVRELEAYQQALWDAGTLAVTPVARSVARELLSTSFTFATQPALPGLRLLTWWLLPSKFREAYGVQWTPARERRAQTLAHLIHTLLPAIPPLMRYWPASRTAAARV
jgi:uncharacterized protein (DUF2236 family)